MRRERRASESNTNAVAWRIEGKKICNARCGSAGSRRTDVGLEKFAVENGRGVGMPVHRKNLLRPIPPLLEQSAIHRRTTAVPASYCAKDEGTKRRYPSVSPSCSCTGDWERWLSIVAFQGTRYFYSNFLPDDSRGARTFLKRDEIVRAVTSLVNTVCSRFNEFRSASGCTISTYPLLAWFRGQYGAQKTRAEGLLQFMAAVIEASKQRCACRILHFRLKMVN